MEKIKGFRVEAWDEDELIDVEDFDSYSGAEEQASKWLKEMPFVNIVKIKRLREAVE
jgi:hypothetical protein